MVGAAEEASFAKTENARLERLQHLFVERSAVDRGAQSVEVRMHTLGHLLLHAFENRWLEESVSAEFRHDLRGSECREGQREGLQTHGAEHMGKRGHRENQAPSRDAMLPPCDEDKAGECEADGGDREKKKTRRSKRGNGLADVSYSRYNA
jgi:hypothetical protein